MTAKTKAKKTTSKKAPGDIVEIQDSDGDSDGDFGNFRTGTDAKEWKEIHGILRTLQDEIDALKKFLKAKEPEIKRLRKAQEKLRRFRALRNNLRNRAIRALDGQ